jgi:hypothetical protein
MRIEKYLNLSIYEALNLEGAGNTLEIIGIGKVFLSRTQAARQKGLTNGAT